MLKKLSFSSSIKDGDSTNQHVTNAPPSASSKSGKLGHSKSHIHDCKLTEVSVISNSKCTTSTAPSKIDTRIGSTTGSGTTKFHSSINGQRACNNSPVIARPGASVDTVTTTTETGYTSEACTAKSSANTESSSRVNIPLPTLGSANQPSLAKPTTAFTSLTTSVSSTSSANPIEARNSPIETISSKVTPGTIVHHHQSKHSVAAVSGTSLHHQSHLHSKSSSRNECPPRHGLTSSTGKSMVTTTTATASTATTTAAATSTSRGGAMAGESTGTVGAATTATMSRSGGIAMSSPSTVCAPEYEISKKQREQRRKEIKREFAKNWETAASANLDKSGCNMSFVFDPSGRLIYYWSMIVSLAFVYNAWVIMYRFAFDEINETSVTLWMPLDGVADLIYLCDILINFRIGYLEEGVLQTDGAKLRQHYMNSTLFYVDCLCLLPLDFLYLSIGFNSMLRCFRLVKIYRFWSFLDRTERHTNYPNVFRTLSLLHYILVLFHWNACLYELISKRGGFGSHDWFGGSRIEECPDVDCDYLHAFYWSTLALTTIGDLPRPRTKGEYVFLIIELLMGLFLLATVLGHVANIVTNVSAARSAFQAKLDAVKTYMRMRRVPEHLKVKVIKWFDYLWSTQKTADEEKSVGFLPAKLKAEIAIHVHLDTLKRVEIFQNTEAGFLCALVLRLQPVLFSPQDYVCRKGEIGKEMYIVNRGKLQVVADNGKTVLATLRAGSYFGEISILNMGPAGNRRTASVRSVGYSDLFCLNKNDMWDVLKDYPAARVRLEAIAVKRLEKYRKEPFKKISMGRSRSTPGLVESKSNLNIDSGTTGGANRSEVRREKKSAVHLTPSPVGHGGHHHHHHHPPTSSASVANLISSSEDQVEPGENQSHAVDQEQPANASVESNCTLHQQQQQQQHPHQPQQQQQHRQSILTSVHPVTYGESGDSGASTLLPAPPTYTSVQVSPSHGPPPVGSAAQVGHSITNTTQTLGLTLATPTYPSSVPICSSYLFASASQYEPKSPLYHYTTATTTWSTATTTATTSTSTTSTNAIGKTSLHGGTDRRPSTPSPIDLIGVTIATGGSSSSTVQSPCLDTSSAFKPMSPALSAPHLQSAILPSSSSSMHPMSPEALTSGLLSTSTFISTSNSAIPLSRTPIPGEMSQELLILEIKRLRDRLQTLECENAAMTSKLNQQSWEVCNRLAEIEFQISTNSGGVGGSSSIGATGSSTFQSTSCNIADRSTDVSIDLTRHAIVQQSQLQQQSQAPYSSTTSGTATVSPSGSSSGSVTCDESERNRESVI